MQDEQGPGYLRHCVTAESSWGTFAFARRYFLIRMDGGMIRALSLNPGDSARESGLRLRWLSPSQIGVIRPADDGERRCWRREFDEASTRAGIEPIGDFAFIPDSI